LSDSPSEISNPKSPKFGYIFVPNFTTGHGGMFIREDKFDYMTPKQHLDFLAKVAPYQPSVTSGSMSESKFLSNRADRVKRRDARIARKDTKAADKEQRQEERTESKDAARAARGGKDILGQVISGAQGIIGDLNPPPLPPAVPPGMMGGLPSWAPIALAAGGGLLLVMMLKK
jgi:hypothetical protein